MSSHPPVGNIYLELQSDIFPLIMQSQQISIEGSSEKQQEEIFQILQPPPAQQKQESTANQQTISIKLNDYYVIIKTSEINNQFSTDEEWLHLLRNKFAERQQNISFIALNSILGLKTSNSELRLKIWQSAISQEESANQNEQQQVETDEKIAKQLDQNMQKLIKKLDFQQKERSELKILLTHLLKIYEASEPHLGTIKGLEYICMGIYISSPNKSYQFLKWAFFYFMKTLNIRNMFYHGSPLFYSEIKAVCHQLKNQSPKLYEFLTQNEVDWSKIFIAYYRSLLTNKLKNKVVISKIFDLVLIYGICIVRMILVRVISRNEEYILQHEDPEEVMHMIATNLICIEFQKQVSQKTEQMKQKKLTQQKQQHEEQKVTKIFRKLIIGSQAI